MANGTTRPVRWGPTHPLSAAGQAPAAPGLYRLFRAGSLVYTGKATSLRDRLGQHRWCLTHLAADRSLARFTYSIAPMPGSTDPQRSRAERSRINWHQARGRLPQQREAEIGAGEAEAFLVPDARAVWAFWRRQLEIVARAFQQQRYGCWCGPGNVCTTTADALDECCRAHDAGYAAVGVTSAGIGGVNMWSVEGLKRTEPADAALVACAARNLANPGLGPAARAYARGVMTVFGTRAQAARIARLLGL